MIKRIAIWFLCLSILGVQLLSAEEKFLSLKKIRQMLGMGLVWIIQLNMFTEKLIYP